jgi:hypothetical protein
MVEADEKWAFCELHPSAVDKLDRTIAAIARTKARIEAEEILSRASAIRTSNV